MNRLFFISGLGANERAFSNINNLDVESTVVKWMKNEPEETLEEYAHKVIDKYSITRDDGVAGLSFGGLLAQEIAYILKMDKVILISSFRDKGDLKPILKFGLKHRLDKWIPPFNIPILNSVIINYLNSETASSKPLLDEMLNQTDYDLMKWSLTQIFLSSRERYEGIELINILGTNDRIIGQWSNRTTHVIKDGSHFMVYEKADEIIDIINGVVAESKHIT